MTSKSTRKTKLFITIKNLAVFQLIIILFSCNQNPSKNEPNPDVYSNLLQENVKSIPEYSLEDSETVYKNLKFGDSKEKYDKVIADYFQYISDSKFRFTPAFNDDNQLYSLDISGAYRSANYLDTEIKDEVYLLYNVIKEKYGEPYNKKEFPNIIDLNSGYVKWIFMWVMNDKLITIGVGKSNYQSTFYSNMHIWNKKMLAESNTQRNKKKQSEIKRDSENF